MGLTEKMKIEILKLNGKTLYQRIMTAEKMDNKTRTEAFAFWLNQHKIRHDKPFFIYIGKKTEKIRGKDVERLTRTVEQSPFEPKLYWERYDPEISVQTIKNEFEVAWNKNKSLLEKEVEETFNLEN